MARHPAALISGGATLLGESTVDCLISDGFHVAIADVDVANGQRIASEHGDQCFFIAIDVTNESSVSEGVVNAAEQLGSLDVLVNMAATYLDPGLDADAAAWIYSLQVNVIGAALMVKYSRPYLAQSDRASIVNVGSVSADRAQPGKLLYPAGKAAVAQLTRNLALDLAAEGIRVNSVSPSWIWSAPIKARSGDNLALADEVAKSFHILNRLGRPSDIAFGISFLCSERAAFITGENLHIDGGYLALSPEGKVNPWVARERRLSINSPGSTGDAG
jgi:NAD(P)-dependent dehydrogenase (short-subunit alcohol dehydrogenase family)